MVGVKRTTGKRRCKGKRKKKKMMDAEYRGKERGGWRKKVRQKR